MDEKIFVVEIDPIIKPNPEPLKELDYKQRVRKEMLNNIIDNINNLEKTMKKFRFI